MKDSPAKEMNYKFEIIHTKNVKHFAKVIEMLLLKFKITVPSHLAKEVY